MVQALLLWAGWGLIGVLVSVFAIIAALFGWEIKQMPGISFGDPVDRAGEQHLSWWQVPIWVKKSKWYQHDRLTRCRVSIRIFNHDTLSGVWTTISGPIDTMDLIEGDETQYIPIVARSTHDHYAISGDPRMRPYVRLEKGIATITDLSALIHGTGITTLHREEYTLQLIVRIPGKTRQEIPSRIYHLSVPDEQNPNRDFILR